MHQLGREILRDFFRLFVKLINRTYLALFRLTFSFVVHLNFVCFFSNVFP